MHARNSFSTQLSGRLVRRTQEAMPAAAQIMALTNEAIIAAILRPSSSSLLQATDTRTTSTSVAIAMKMSAAASVSISQ